MRLLPLLCLLGVAACYTRFDVKPVKPDDQKTRGVRYALPKVYLRATPAPDGTMTVETVFLPDPDHTYAIDARSYLAKHDLNVDVEGGLLKKVEFNPDNTAIASQAVSTAKEVAKAQLDAEAERRKKEKQDYETKLKSRSDAVDSARKTVMTAQAKLDALIAEGAPETAIRDARVALAVAEAELRYAEEQLADFRNGGENLQDKLLREAEAQAKGTEDQVAFATEAKEAAEDARAFGPALFYVKQEQSTVTLIPVPSPPGHEPQGGFRTSFPPKLEPQKPRLSTEGGEPVVPYYERYAEAVKAWVRADARVKALGSAGGAQLVTAKLQLSDAVVALEEARIPTFVVRSTVDLTGVQAFMPPVGCEVKLVGARQVLVTCKPNMAPRRYVLILLATYLKKGVATKFLGTAPFTVARWPDPRPHP